MFQYVGILLENVIPNPTHKRYEKVYVSIC